MPEFDLGQPYKAEYHVANLPRIEYDCGVHLYVSDPKQRWMIADKREIGGRLQLELRDSHGIVVTTDGKLGDYTWNGLYHTPDASDYCALYQSERSFFMPKRGEEYHLRFSYVPDPQLKGYKGCAFLRCGGFK